MRDQFLETPASASSSRGWMPAPYQFSQDGRALLSAASSMQGYALQENYLPGFSQQVTFSQEVPLAGQLDESTSQVVEFLTDPQVDNEYKMKLWGYFNLAKVNEKLARGEAPTSKEMDAALIVLSQQEINHIRSLTTAGQVSKILQIGVSYVPYTAFTILNFACIAYALHTYSNAAPELDVTTKMAYSALIAGGLMVVPSVAPRAAKAAADILAVTASASAAAYDLGLIPGDVMFKVKIAFGAVNSVAILTIGANAVLAAHTSDDALKVALHQKSYLSKATYDAVNSSAASWMMLISTMAGCGAAAFSGSHFPQQDGIFWGAGVASIACLALSNMLTSAKTTRLAMEISGQKDMPDSNAKPIAPACIKLIAVLGVASACGAAFESYKIYKHPDGIHSHEMSVLMSLVGAFATLANSVIPIAAGDRLRSATQDKTINAFVVADGHIRIDHSMSQTALSTLLLLMVAGTSGLIATSVQETDEHADHSIVFAAGTAVVAAATCVFSAAQHVLAYQRKDTAQKVAVLPNFHDRPVVESDRVVNRSSGRGERGDHDENGGVAPSRWDRVFTGLGSATRCISSLGNMLFFAGTKNENCGFGAGHGAKLANDRPARPSMA